MGQGYEGPRPSPPRLPARRRRPQEVAAGLAAARLAAVTLSVRTAAGGAVELLPVQTVAEQLGVCEPPVGAGTVQTVTLIQLRGGRAGRGAAAPRAARVGLGWLRLETGTLVPRKPGEWFPCVNSTAMTAALTAHCSVARQLRSVTTGAPAPSLLPVATVTQRFDKVTSQQEALTCVYGESLVLGLDLDPLDRGVRTPPPPLLWTSEVLDAVWSRDSWTPLYSVSLRAKTDQDN